MIICLIVYLNKFIKNFHTFSINMLLKKLKSKAFQKTKHNNKHD